MTSHRYLSALTAAFVLLFAAEAWALEISYELNVSFGSDPADGTVSITFDDNGGTGDVQITLDASGLATDENVTQWYFSYSGDGGTTFDATGLTASNLSGTGSDSLTLADIEVFGSQSEQADGDGTYNIVVDFNTSPPRFDGGEIVQFTLSGTGLTADDFAFLSDTGGNAGGPFYSAAKIQNTNCVTASMNPDGCNDPMDLVDDNEGSDWLGAVPEPGALALFATSLIVASAMTRRPRR